MLQQRRCNHSKCVHMSEFQFGDMLWSKCRGRLKRNQLITVDRTFHKTVERNGAPNNLSFIVTFKHLSVFVIPRKELSKSVMMRVADLQHSQSMGLHKGLGRYACQGKHGFAEPMEIPHVESTACVGHLLVMNLRAKDRMYQLQLQHVEPVGQACFPIVQVPTGTLRQICLGQA